MSAADELADEIERGHPIDGIADEFEGEGDRLPVEIEEAERGEVIQYELVQEGQVVDTGWNIFINVDVVVQWNIWLKEATKEDGISPIVLGSNRSWEYRCLLGGVYVFEAKH